MAKPTEEEKQLLEMMQKSRVGPAMDTLADIYQAWIKAGRPGDIGEFQRNYKPGVEPREAWWRELLRNLPIVIGTVAGCLVVMALFYQVIQYAGKR